MKPVLVDTDVLIDFLRGSTAAVNWMDQLQKRPLVSVITVAELRSGMKGKEEPALEHLVGAMAVCPIDATIARLGGDFRRQYGPSHGTGLADALIAATAVSENAALRTFNVRHFPMLEDVQEPYRK
jgi:predicted nucleic acid-binding protein